MLVSLNKTHSREAADLFMGSQSGVIRFSLRSDNRARRHSTSDSGDAIVSLPTNRQTEGNPRNRILRRRTLCGFSIPHASVLLLDNIDVHESKAVKKHPVETGFDQRFMPA
jgi:hypothetical protein